LALADLGIALAGAALPSIAIEVSRFLGHREQHALPAPADASTPSIPAERPAHRPADRPAADRVRLKPDDAAPEPTALSPHERMSPGGAR
jgi:hypothetical protein